MHSHLFIIHYIYTSIYICTYVYTHTHTGGKRLHARTQAVDASLIRLRIFMRIYIFYRLIYKGVELEGRLPGLGFLISFDYIDFFKEGFHTFLPGGSLANSFVCRVRSRFTEQCTRVE